MSSFHLDVLPVKVHYKKLREVLQYNVADTFRRGYFLHFHDGENKKFATYAHVCARCRRAPEFVQIINPRISFAIHLLTTANNTAIRYSVLVHRYVHYANTLLKHKINIP